MKYVGLGLGISCGYSYFLTAEAYKDIDRALKSEYL